jgi:hypothetical protein
MHRLGWMSDSHIDPTSDAGAGSGLTDDIVDLFERRDVDHIYFNGDAVFQAGAFSDGEYAHSTPEYYDRFWRLVDNSGYGDRMVVTPGNHDVPLQYFLESDDRAHLRYKHRYSDDGVTVLMVNTVGPGWVSGGQEAGYGWTNGYVPYKQLRWLDEELAAAGDDAKLVFFHHHAWLTPGDPLASSDTDTQTIDQLYWVCRNYRAIHNVLSSHDKVVCPQAHTAQFATEGSSCVDGVHYLYKKHYYNVRNGGLTTYAYIHANADSCRVTTIDHDTREKNVILETRL